MGHQGNFRLSAPVRGIVLVALGVLLSLMPFPGGSAWAQVGSARYSAIIVEAHSGRIIMGVNQDELRFPASLTKLMTLYMTFEALRDRRVQLNQYVPVSAWAAAQAPSKLGLQPGEALTVEQAILGLVTKSANDAASALGEFLGGSEDRFAQMMTLRARALGMNRTNFRNASGLPDSNQWTTARDLATLGRRLVLDFPQLYGYFGVSGFIWRNRVIPNHDTLLRTYPGADGMKTGYTNYAGHNLVSSAVRGNVRLIGVVMGAASNTERDQHMTMLLDNGFGQANGTTMARFGNPLITLANAATSLSFRTAQPAVPAGRPVLAPRASRDRGVQIGGFVAERTAWEVAQESARIAPGGQARVQPVIVGRRATYHAQLLGVSETEARTVCANLSRRGAACQPFRMEAARSTLR
ncbi:MAG: D-alanyl-D-alanine carboxypeptidase [Acetobacteraceae bacterium]|nr:D-alanyl-D-alanine carboxypeptidase [Acetobacteraceae bacterium]